MGAAKRDARRRERTDPDEVEGGLRLRTLHPIRFRQIKAFLEGNRSDAPTPEELDEFVDTVAAHIEGALARHAPIHDLLALLNAGRDERQHMAAPGGAAGAGGGGDDDDDDGGGGRDDDAGAAGEDTAALLPASDEDWMGAALREAEAAAADGEVPVGAVVVRGGRVLGRGRNQRERLRDPTAHAEMIALTQAAEAAGTWRLDGATMVVTLEPCPMCAGALVNARIGRLVYGADDPKAGACGSLMDIVSDRRLNHRIPVTRGILAGPCGEILRRFFRARRGDAKTTFPE